MIALSLFNILLGLIGTIGLTAVIAAGTLYLIRLQRLERRIKTSQSEWLEVRRAMYSMLDPADVAAQYGGMSLPGGMLIRNGWIPISPIPSEAIEVTFDEIEQDQLAVKAQKGVLPKQSDGKRFPSYSAAIAELDQPALWENRTTYRVTELNLDGREPNIRLELSHYFKRIDLGESLTHELALCSGIVAKSQLRKSLGDLTNLNNHLAQGAVDVLTLRISGTSTTFLLHDRDQRKVASEGDRLQVIPSGVFQPSSEAMFAAKADAEIWKSVVREYAEELLGVDEAIYSQAGRIDYETLSPYSAFWNARRDGTFKLFVLGAGVNPLQSGVNFFCAGVFLDTAFDRIFEKQIRVNSEGRISQLEESDLGYRGFSLDDATVDQLMRNRRLLPQGKACIQLAMQHINAIRGSVLAPMDMN